MLEYELRERIYTIILIILLTILIIGLGHIIIINPFISVISIMFVINLIYTYM